MKEKLCLKKTLFACLSFLFLSFACAVLLPSSPTHALSISSTSYLSPNQNSYLTYKINNGSNVSSTYSSSDGPLRYFSTLFSDNISISALSVNLWANAPANSISTLHFDFVFSGGSDFSRPFSDISNLVNSDSTNGPKYQVLNSDCNDDFWIADASNKYSLSCDVVVYNASATNQYYFNLNLFAGNNGSTTTSVLFMSRLSRISYFVLNYDSLSENDKDWLSDDFLDAMTDAVAEGERQANEEVKQETQTQTQQSESTSNTQGSSSETQGQTLLQAFSSFVSAITNVQPAQNCDLDVDFSGYASGLQTTIDLCELSPPAGLTFIGSILLILFCVPLSISTVRKLISLFRSFQT